MDVSATQTALPTRPGKSAQAVGQLAKVAVADARAAGVDLPRNAQGLAASAIAKGAEPASVFAAKIAALTPVEDPLPDATPADTPDAAPMAQAPEETDTTDLADLTPDTPLTTGAETALSLLKDDG